MEFGQKQADPMENILTGDASDFEGGTTGGWSSWGSGKGSGKVQQGMGKDGSYGLVLTAKDGNFWEAQNAYTFSDYLDNTKKYMIQFWAKSSTAAGTLQFQYQNGTTYGSQGGYTSFNVGTEWTLCEATFTPGYADVNRILINFGQVGGTYQIDNIKFGVAKDQGSAAGAKQFVFANTRAGKRRATTITYTSRPPRRSARHCSTPWTHGSRAWPTTSPKSRWCPMAMMSSTSPSPTAPTRCAASTKGLRRVDHRRRRQSPPTTAHPPKRAEGLNLNWGSNRFYWGYYVKDYAVQAFQKAVSTCPPRPSSLSTTTTLR